MNPEGLCRWAHRDRSNETPATPAWKITPNTHLLEALGLLKDWVTTLLSLQTTIIAAVAGFVGFKGPGDFVHLGRLELLLLSGSAASAFCSIIAGTFLLNALPAAAQRKAVDENGPDLYSIVTVQPKGLSARFRGYSIRFWTFCFRNFFLGALFGLVAFVVAKVVFYQAEPVL
jgi:hypothetical protein